MIRPRIVWRNLIHRRAVDQDLDEEVGSYVDELAAENERAGMSPAAARRAALVEVGGVESVKQGVRESRAGAGLDSLIADLRYSVRCLRRTRGFTVIALVTLALGIGANTALFSVADEVFLKSLPVTNPDELVLLQWQSGPRWIGGTIAGMSVDPVSGSLASTAFSKLAFERFRARATRLSSVIAFTSSVEVQLPDGERALAQLVSGNYFTGLGLRPAVGRLLTPDDDREGAPPVAVISYRFWQRRFGLQPAAIGEVLTTVTPAGRTAYTIVGVTPPGFAGTGQLGRAPDFSSTLASEWPSSPFGGKSPLGVPWYWPLRVLGRLVPGATYEQVQTELQGALESAALEGWRAMPRRRADPSIPKLEVAPGGKGLVEARRNLRSVVGLMAAFVGLVLLIVCTNLANLLLARAAGRQRELAVRAALGARRGRLVRQLVAESAMLALAGGASGIVVAYWTKDLFLAWIHRTNPWFTLEPRLDLRVLAFTAGVSLLTGVLAGVYPALRGTRLDLTRSIKDGSATAGGPRGIVSRGLMVAQVAVSLVLLIGAGLFLRTVGNLRAADVGFDKSNLLLFNAEIRRAAPATNAHESFRGSFDDVLDQLGQIPGARRATYSSIALLSGDLAMPVLYVPGRVAGADDRTVYTQQVHATFFDTMGMPVSLGRGFTPGDGRQGSPAVVVVNEALARRYFPGVSAVGQRIGITKSPTESMPDSALLEIVGVVRDAKFTTVRQEPPAAAFTPFGGDDNRAIFAVRTTTDPIRLVPEVRDLSRRAGLIVDDFRSQEDAAAATFAEERHFAVLTSLFGALAAGLACLGLYGVMSYEVARRTHEIGVRMALGAPRGRMVAMIMSETLAMAAAGVAIGLVAALGLGRLIAGLLYGVPPTDTPTLGAAALLMLGVAVLAGYVPGCRASRVDPLVALRTE